MERSCRTLDGAIRILSAGNRFEEKRFGAVMRVPEALICVQHSFPIVHKLRFATNLIE